MRMTIRMVGFELRSGERSIQVREVVVARQDDDRSGLDLGLAQDTRQPRVADDQAGSDVRQVLLGVRRGPDPDDGLVSRSKLVDRPDAEMVETTHDRMTAGRHARSLRARDVRIPFGTGLSGASRSVRLGPDGFAVVVRLTE